MIIRWGILGAGGVADRQMLPATRDLANARTVAVMRRTLDGARAIAEKYNIPRYYDRVEDLLADPEVDAVYVATPVNVHSEQVVAAAERGKHVLCEKPMARTVDECQRMVDACAAHGVKLMVCFPLRFSPTNQRLREAVQGGELGDLVLARVQLAKWYPLDPMAWRSDPARGGGGVLMDLGSHLLDFLRFVVGEITAVAAFIANRSLAVPVEDTAALLLRFANGAHGFLDTSFSVFHSENLVEIYGTRGTAWIGPGPEGRTARLILPGGEEVIDRPAVHPYRAEMEHFSQCLLEGTEPLSTGLDGLRNVALIQAAYRAAREGRVVTG